MVKFRNLLSKPETQKKKAVKKPPAESTPNDRFSFSNFVSKEEEAPEEKPHSIPSNKRPESKRIRPLTPTSRIKFKDIYPKELQEPVSETLPEEEQVLENLETDTAIEDVTQPVTIETDAIRSKDREAKRSYAITQISSSVGKSRQVLYDAAAKYLSEVLVVVRTRRKFSLSPGFKIIHQMVETQPPYDPLFANAIHTDNPGEYIVYHSVNVSIFAIKMAHFMGFSNQNQIEIGMAGLLHDVGMALIPEDILFKDGKLSRKELSMLRERPINSFKILRFVGEKYPYLAESANQVYERIDGSGYPMGLQGDEINEYAQIIGLVSVYEALVHSRPQRARFLHFTAVKEIMKRDKRGFQKKHLKALLNIFSIFPLSSYVKLNSNAIGQVIETYPDYPMRPKLQIIYDSQKQRVLTDRIIDLSKNPLLYITDSVSEDEIEAPSVR